MTPIGSFSAVAATWQNFYLLVGAGAATLIGLMFVAVTFGAGLVTKESATVARSFIDPILNHFVQVLFTACLVTIPTMGSTLLGVIVLAVGAFRLGWLLRIYRHMRQAHAKNNDMELSDWMSGIIVPLVTYVAMIAAGAGFLLDYRASFSVLAVVTIVALLNGILTAWETMLWMAITRNEKS